MFACDAVSAFVPALRASRVDLNDALKQGGGRAASGGGAVATSA
jgi:hypothetical protein